MLEPSRNVMPSWTPRCWAKSSSRSQTPRWAQRMKVCAARDQGPSSAGMARHLAPFACRQTRAEIVRRRSWGGVLPLGRHVSISGSRSIHAPSVRIAPSSFQEEQNARHHKQFKLEQALKASQDQLLAERKQQQEAVGDLSQLQAQIASARDELQALDHKREQAKAQSAAVQQDRTELTKWLDGKRTKRSEKDSIRATKPARSAGQSAVTHS